MDKLHASQAEGGASGDGTNPGSPIPDAAELVEANVTTSPTEEHANTSNTQELPDDMPANATSPTDANSTFPRPFNPRTAVTGARAPALPVVMQPTSAMLHPPTTYDAVAVPHPAAMVPHPGMFPHLGMFAAPGPFAHAHPRVAPSIPQAPPAKEGFAGPWIGILGAPTDPQCEEAAAKLRSRGSLFSSAPEVPSSCFNSYYAEWLASAGARVFGIPFDASDALLDALLPAASGIVWPGGDVIVEPNTTLYQTARRLLDRVINENRAGRLLPLLTICQGHEILASLVHGSTEILTTDSFTSDGVALPVAFTPEAEHSQFLQTLGPQATNLLRAVPLATHLNADGITPQAFASSRNLAVLFRILATTTDLEGLPMVSIMEARTMPIISFQWHPERSQFDWRKRIGAPHTPEAITTMAAIADAFVNIARLAPRAVATDEAASIVSQTAVFGMRRVPIGEEPLAGVTSLLFDPPVPAGVTDRASSPHKWRLSSDNLAAHRKDAKVSMEDQEPEGEGVNATTGEPLAAGNATQEEEQQQQQQQQQVEEQEEEGSTDQDEAEAQAAAEQEEQEAAAAEGVDGEEGGEEAAMEQPPEAFREVRGRSLHHHKHKQRLTQ